MTLEQFQRYQEETFDAFCKAVIRNESANAHNEMDQRAEKEITFSSLSPAELQSFQTEDIYHGNVYCGHCGNRLTLTTSGRVRTRSDGTVQNGIQLRYICHYKVKHPDKCDGPSGYGTVKLDGIVDQIIRYQLSKIQANSSSQTVAKQHEQSVALAKARYRLACNQLSEKQKELTDLQSETIKVIRGESRLSIDLLNELVAKAKEEISLLTVDAEEAKAYLGGVQNSAVREEQELSQLKTWADLYDNCTFAAKKMIVSQFIKSIHVYRDYTLEVEFNVSFEEFRKISADTKNLGNERAEVYTRAE